MNLVDITEGALSEIRAKSQLKLYRRDPEAWLSDVLDKRWWSKQSEIAHSVVGTGSGQTFTLVKSANGVGKTQLGADLMTWAVATHDPLDVTVLATANVFTQISQNAFKYITNNYGDAALRGVKLPGRVVSDPAVRFDRGRDLMPKDIIIGRRPADKNLISSFQGTHDGFVMVLLDEAGGLPEDLWIGAYAVTTNQHTAILALGNPDELNTGFHRRFTNEEKYSEWNRFTISAFDTPNFTGEVLYPDDPARDKHVKSLMIQPKWASRMEREAHPNVYRAKVLGEFPDSSDTSFFPQSAIEKAWNTVIEPTDDATKILGIDLSFAGEDKTTFYLNVGGRIRKIHEYNKIDDPEEHARRIHEQAVAYDVDVVQVDANGPGGGPFARLEAIPNKPYLAVGLLGGRAASDNSRWAQARSEQYDNFREGMQLGKIDLDPEDSELRDQLYSQTYKINARSAIQILSKSDMRAQGLHSPDHLDAAIYSWYKHPDIFGDLLPEGTVLTEDPTEIPDFGLQEYLMAPGNPILG